MKHTTARLLAGILTLAALGAYAGTPTDVVLQRMQAVNAHDFDAFVAVHADDVVFSVYPNRELGRGHAHLEFIFADTFARKAIRVEVHRVIEADSFVIVESTTTFANGSEHGIAIYEVRDAKIASVCFVRDALRARRTPLAEPVRRPTE